MSSVKKMIATAFWAAVALPVAIAAPPRAARDILSVNSHISHSGGVVTNTATAAPAAVTATGAVSTVSSTQGSAAAAAATCTHGIPVSKQRPSEWPIDNYSNVVPNETWTSYEVKQDWYDAHFISGPHYMGFSHEEGDFGPFKCQYTCNAAGNCNSYFIWFDNPNTENEHMSCVLFDAVITESDFSPFSGTLASGAYDRVCKPNN